MEVPGLIVTPDKLLLSGSDAEATKATRQCTCQSKPLTNSKTKIQNLCWFSRGDNEFSYPFAKNENLL